METGDNTNSVFSDVDMLPHANVDFGDCQAKPTQFCSEISQFSYSVAYDAYAGGVIGATPEHWLKFNGFSNKGRGWGGEDDVLYHRMNHAGLLDQHPTRFGGRKVPRRPEKGKGRCESLNENHTYAVVKHDLGGAAP